MAILSTEDKQMQINDGDYITDAAEQLGALIACRGGACGECLIKVTKGMENLSGLSKKEKELSIHPPYRLACMCKIKKGEVEIKI